MVDLFMFREGTDEDNYTNQPRVTTGSIVWGILLRTLIIVILSFILFQVYDWYRYWWLSVFAIWLLAAYPAYRQYKKFNDRMDLLEEEILCGSCKYFNKTGQLCMLFDEHVSKNHTPCEGNNWEPKSYEEKQL